MGHTLDTPSAEMKTRKIASRRRWAWTVLILSLLILFIAATSTTWLYEDAALVILRSETPVASAPPDTQSREQRPNQLQSEEELWNKVTATNHTTWYESYLREYPAGRYAAEAKRRLEILNQQTSPTGGTAGFSTRVPATSENGEEQASTHPLPPLASTKESYESLPKSDDAAKSQASPSSSEEKSHSSLGKREHEGSYITQGFARIDSLPTGSAAVSAPVNVEIGEPFVVYLRVLPGDVFTLKKSLERELPNNFVGDAKPKINISGYMAARVHGRGFSIQPLTDEIQAVSLSGPTTWQWEVTSGRFGTRTLNFTLSCYISVQNNEKPHGCYSYPLKMEVAVSPWPFLREYWQWIIGSLLLPLLPWSWALYNQSKTSENAQRKLSNNVRERIRRRKPNKTG